MVTHRVDGQQPIEYSIEGLKYEQPHIEQCSKTTQYIWSTFKLCEDQCLTQYKELVYFTMPSDTYLPLDIKA